MSLNAGLTPESLIFWLIGVLVAAVWAVLVWPVLHYGVLIGALMILLLWGILFWQLETRVSGEVDSEDPAD